ncbi:hypothetical protein CPB84DRAFT_1813345 [Gymnopilus junonius]|uniref:Tetraspanin n=1 Tax=Gymnopilus junonius TaxID=109634 RepID=A0A9P5TRU7_GYMJU|nr:hypothetical protein CPB84DRAFT_1813345 [Gymnopilus junonius]
MSVVRSRKFCCFLPVRLGVFILAILAMVGGSFTAAAGWIQVTQLKQLDLDKAEQIALWIHAVMFTILSLVAVFGFVGAIIKNRRMISSFANALAIHLGFSIAAGIFTLYSLFKKNSQDAVNQCMSASPDATLEGCQTAIAIMKGLMVAIYVVTWLVELYFYFIVERYVEQLNDEELAQRTVVIPRTMHEVPPQVTTYNAYGNSGYAPPYAFTEPRQAFGSSNV